MKAMNREEIEKKLLKEGSRVVPIRWEDRRLSLLDQRLLPSSETWTTYDDPDKVAHAITSMVVRGAPAIGITAAFGMVLAAFGLKGQPIETFKVNWLVLAKRMLEARPTAVNLRWAVHRLQAIVTSGNYRDVSRLARRLEQEALAIWYEDIMANITMGKHGQALLPAGAGILTHCNAGALATGGYGTALGVLRAAVSAGKGIRIFADETRPWLQGSRLTAWELLQDGIPVTIVIDSAAGYLMRKGDIEAVIVGADRIAANGDVANKIGTYGVAELARANGIPFYVAAPTSTIDLDTPSGETIPVEERAPGEVTSFAGHPVAASGAAALNPVFDITPNDLVTAIITEKGIIRPPYRESLYAILT